MAWGNYLRSVLKVGHIYSFTDLRHNLYFLVAEHKSFAGREKIAENESIGRPLSVAWFEKDRTVGLGDLVILKRPLTIPPVTYVRFVITVITLMVRIPVLWYTCVGPCHVS